MRIRTQFITKAHKFLSLIQEDSKIYKQKDYQLFDQEYSQLQNQDQQQWMENLLNITYHLIQQQEYRQAKQILVLIINKANQYKLQAPNQEVFEEMIQVCWLRDSRLSKQQADKNLSALKKCQFDTNKKLNLIQSSSGPKPAKTSISEKISNAFFNLCCSCFSSKKSQKKQTR